MVMMVRTAGAGVMTTFARILYCGFHDADCEDFYHGFDHDYFEEFDHGYDHHDYFDDCDHGFNPDYFDLICTSEGCRQLRTQQCPCRH